MLLEENRDPGCEPEATQIEVTGTGTTDQVIATLKLHQYTEGAGATAAVAEVHLGKVELKLHAPGELPLSSPPETAWLP